MLFKLTNVTELKVKVNKRPTLAYITHLGIISKIKVQIRNSKLDYTYTQGTCIWINIVAAFRGMHVSPAKHSYAWLPRKCDYRTDARTDGRTDGQTDARQSDTYVPLCFAGDTKRHFKVQLWLQAQRHNKQVRANWFLPIWNIYASGSNNPYGKKSQHCTFWLAPHDTILMGN